MQAGQHEKVAELPKRNEGSKPNKPFCLRSDISTLLVMDTNPAEDIDAHKKSKGLGNNEQL